MGISASKVSHHLRTFPDFTAACNTVFSDIQNLNPPTSPGKIYAHELPIAAILLHCSISHDPLLNTWCPSPPSLEQVDDTYRSMRQSPPPVELETLGFDEFKEFAVVVFTNAVISNASKAMVRKVGIGVAGISGVGMLAVVLLGRGLGFSRLGLLLRFIVGS